jgi:hypothetical protein
MKQLFDQKLCLEAINLIKTFKSDEATTVHDLVHDYIKFMLMFMLMYSYMKIMISYI